MARRKNLTDEQVADLKPREKRYTFADLQLPNLFVRVSPTGAKFWYVVERNVWTRIGPTAAWPVEKARDRARQILRGEAKSETIDEVVARYIQRHVTNLRSARVVRSYLEIILQEFRGREFASIRRGELAALGDRLAETRGNRTAEYILITFNAMSRWYAKRTDNYSPVMAPGMAGEYHNASRSRILSDEELRAVWLAAEKSNDNFGALVRLLLLTTQRRERVAAMRWDEVRDGTWHIPRGEREKQNAGELVLPEPALAIIDSMPRMGSNPFVLAARDGGHFTAFGWRKKIFDQECDVSKWVLHDLRRTARSLMARAGVRSDVAERVLGHTIKGVEGIYDRHDYREEKQRALVALASMIESIVRPAPTTNVLRLRG
jgi:hypothetical protein